MANTNHQQVWSMDNSKTQIMRRFETGLGIRSSVFWLNRLFFLLKDRYRLYKRSNLSRWSFVKIDGIKSLTVDLWKDWRDWCDDGSSFSKIDKSKSISTRAIQSFGIKRGGKLSTTNEKYIFLSKPLVFGERFDLFNIFQRSARAIWKDWKIKKIERLKIERSKIERSNSLPWFEAWTIVNHLLSKSLNCWQL